MCLPAGGDICFVFVVGVYRGGRDSGLVVQDLPAHTEGEEEIDCWFAPTIGPQLQERASLLTCPANTLGMALQEVKQQHDLAKAVKADDATVPIHWWHVRVLGYTASAADTRVLTTIQDFVLRCYRQRLQRECISFLVRAHGTDWARKGERGLADVTAMREIVWRALNNGWFEYPFGSRLHYFRFPVKYRALARDGVPIFFVRPGPRQLHPQPTPSNEATLVLKDKVEKMIKRRYLAPPDAKLHSLIKYFAVPKGEGDWRVVYDAGANGLNECVWAPLFYLPSVEALLRIVDHTSIMEDRDIGEMFLNFELHPNTRRFAGVDIRPLCS